MPSLGTRLILTLAMIFQLMVSPTMSQPKCDFLNVAQELIARKFPFIDLSYRHPVTSESKNIWQVRYELPPDTLGFVPVVGIDKQTCAVVHSDVEQ
jgi:hypothetical protein